MTKTLAALTASAAFSIFAVSSVTHAATAGKDAASTSTAQQDRAANNMSQGGPKDQKRACNAQAKGKKGKERRAFLRECLAGTSNATIAPQSQSNKSQPALESPKP